jgi:hypothetical protein
MVRKLVILSFLVSTLTSFRVELFALPKSAPEAVIKLTPHPAGTYMMTVHAKVRGYEGVFVFDTGAGDSYISPTFAEAIGCKPWGQLTGFTLIGKRLDMQRCDGLTFDLNGHEFGAPISGVFDLMKFMPPDAPKVDGSIGLDIFEGHAITLSLAMQQLIVESKDSLSARKKRGKEVPIRFVREAGGNSLSVFVAVPTPAGLAWMEIDSGNGGANVIGKHIAALLNLNPSEKDPQPARFQLSGGVPVEGMARVNETLIMDGNIGTRFLINWDLTLDLANRRAWLAPSKHNEMQKGDTGS